MSFMGNLQLSVEKVQISVSFIFYAVGGKTDILNTTCDRLTYGLILAVE